MDLVTPSFGLLFWQALIFILVLLLLSKFAWKPIMGALSEREQSIEEALLAAESAKTELLKLKADNDKLIQQARAERDKMLKEAQQTASSIVSEAKEAASKEGARLIEQARQTINTEKAAALAEIKNQVADLSINIAEKLIKKELNTDQAQKALVEQYLKDATSVS